MAYQKKELSDFIERLSNLRSMIGIEGLSKERGFLLYQMIALLPQINDWNRGLIERKGF